MEDLEKVQFLNKSEILVFKKLGNRFGAIAKRVAAINISFDYKKKRNCFLIKSQNISVYLIHILNRSSSIISL
jgi:hypothetical protein